ncbi:hypothetical protein RHOSPDRAFT_21605 [Rhodotorula sp. JG-1b]|nr:hypothetical protein RHOSPDRAFT_21605 [Rhodotorula sp. JG-1b]
MPLTELRRPDLPSHILPRLPRSLDSSDLSSEHLLSLVNHLRLLYASNESADDHHNGNDSAAAVRSAQPSAEQVSASEFQGVTVIEDETIDPLWQHDAFERTWTINWLNLIVRRGEEWTSEAEEAGGNNAQELQRRHDLVDQAASLVGVLTATTEGGSILRPLLLPTCLPDAAEQTEPLLITLNDALPSSLDPTSVGLQSWGSSIILARMIALDPHSFGLGYEPNHRVLELGAGTGLLSLVWKAMSERLATPCEMFATDYHEGVLDNLRKNVETNSAAITPITSPTDSPMPPPFDKPFHTILAADVVYGPTHAEWLKSCVEQFLIKPDAGYRPAFHLIVPLRPTHAEAIASIDRAFPKREDLAPRGQGELWRVAIEEITEIERVHGVGRSDEETYRLFRIGWC